jgi:hypothetical protein
MENMMLTALAEQILEFFLTPAKFRLEKFKFKSSAVMWNSATFLTLLCALLL